MVAISAEQFLEQVRSSGIFSDTEFADVTKQFGSQGEAANAQQIARDLVQLNWITVYQAQQIYLGKAKSLSLGNYLILEKLGQGGMGMVYKAIHRRMERVVAIKVLAPAITKKPEALKRFQQEVKAAARLSHPNIAIAYDADVADKTHFLVMEFVDGRNLQTVVTVDGILPLPQAIEYMRQAAAGLAYAHQKGIVHRDVKPSNLVLSNEGVIKILDMGLARIDESNQAGLTHSGDVMGTVDYMAPEQALDARQADARADIYSLGCTLYRLLTGETLYEGQTLVEKLMAHQHRSIPALQSKRADVPRELAQIFERMVAKRPEDRFHSMSEVEAALSALARQSTAVAQPGVATRADATSRLSSFFADLANQAGAKQAGINQVQARSASPPGNVAVAPSLGNNDGTIVSEFGRSSQPPAQDPHDTLANIATENVAVQDETLNERPSPIVAAPLRTNSKPRAASKRGPGNNRWPLIAAGLAGFVLLCAGVIIIIRNQKGEVVGRMELAPGHTAEIEDPAAKPVTPPAVTPPTVTPPRVTMPPSTKPTEAKPPETKTQPSISTATQTLDLLAFVDVQSGFQTGTWTKDGTNLKSQGNRSYLTLPYHPPAEYDYTIEFTLDRGLPHECGLVFPYGENLVGVVRLFLHQDGKISWGTVTEPGSTTSSSTNVPGEPRQRHQLRVEVRKDSVFAYYKDKAKEIWKTGKTVRPGFSPLLDSKAVGLECATDCTLHSVKLKEVSGVGQRLKTVDLLASVDPGKDAERGTWTKDVAGFVAADKDSVLGLPYQPGEEYSFLAELTLNGAEGQETGIVFPYGGGRVAELRLFLDKSGQLCRRIQQESGTSLSGGLGEKPPPGQKHRVQAHVRRQKVVVIVNDRHETVVWTADKVVKPGFAVLKDSKALGVRCQAKDILNKAEVREIGGSGIVLRETSGK